MDLSIWSFDEAVQEVLVSFPTSVLNEFNELMLKELDVLYSETE